jgi:hypothetical protein
MSWTDAYATTRDLYGVTRIVNGARTNPHRGCDFAVKGGDVVPAYEECIVVESGSEVSKGFTAILGWYVVAKSVKDGRYLGWAHLRRGTRPAVGTRLQPGDQVGLAASGPIVYAYQSAAVAGINYPGTAWSGPHIHTTVSDTIVGIFSGTTFDPLPRIRAALASLSGASTNITPITIPGNEDDELTPDQAKALQAIYDAVTPGIAGVKYDGALFQQAKWAAEGAAAVQKSTTDIAKTTATIPALADSIALALQRQLGYGTRIEQAQVDTNSLHKDIAGIKDAVVAAVGSVKIPVDASVVAKALAADANFIAAIAKAVNDDAAKRLVS